jgi:hypothetical protein
MYRFRTLGNQQDEPRERDEHGSKEGEEEHIVEPTLHGRTTCNRRDFLRPVGLANDQLAEAGVDGVLNTFPSERDVVGDTRKGDDHDDERTVDSPTKVFSVAIMPGYSNVDVSPRPIGFQDSWKCVGEPIADDDTEAPDSEDAERIGGCSWKECDIEWGEPAGVWN